MRIKKEIFYSILPIFFSPLLWAQEYTKEESFWNAIFVDYSLSDKLSLRTELHFRTVDYFNAWKQQIFRPQLTFTDSNNILWTAGYSYLKNYTSEVNADPRFRNEHNIWEQVIYNLPLKKGTFSTWIRLEHRFQEVLPPQKNRSLKSFDFSSRIRFRFTYIRPLSMPEAKVPINFVFYDEIFTLMNPPGIPYKFNQNWTFFGFSMKLNSKTTLNTGFQKNTIFKATDQYLKTRLWNTLLIYKL